MKNWLSKDDFSSLNYDIYSINIVLQILIPVIQS